jgi:hypothetical protein
MCEFEPALTAVPNLLIAMLTLECLSKGIEYLKENLVGEAMDFCARRHVMMIMIGAILTVGE